ncbi:antibiotic biosynthesis monooxygenase [Flavobacteriales bacterium]|nr:antibiotic biosynthesis monooxygenase [Flavobacteriales bacterium]
MITRIVELNFHSEHVDNFLTNFQKYKTQIRNFDGCTHLKLLRDKKQKSKFFTYSIWVSELHLENYRESDLFKSIWSETKPLFSSKANAWSVDLIEQLN